jgi:WD40 repeat protein
MAPSTKHPGPPAVYRRPVPITALAFSPDGKTLAASGYHEVTLWDAETGAMRGRLKNLPQRTLGLAWSADGKRLAVAGGTPGAGGELRLIDPAGKAEAKLLDRTADMMLAVRFSPDGSTLAAGGADNAIRIYDGTTGDRKHLIEQHADWVTDVAFSRDGKRLASASRDKTCRVFDVASGTMETAYVEKHDEPVYAVIWNNDGKRLFSGGRDRKLHCWNSENGNSFDDEKKGEKQPKLPGDIQRLGTEGENVLVATADGVVRAFTQGKREPVREYPKLDDWAHVVTVDERTGRVAAGSHDGAVRVWERDGKQVAAFAAVPGR